MNYLSKNILTENTGNNAFAWEMRTERHKKSPTLIIPSIIDGTIEDIKIGTDIVFEETENKELRSCYGLENFVKIGENIVVFDNHNHALYFWLEAVRK